MPTDSLHPSTFDLPELRARLTRCGAEALSTPECLGLALRRGGGRAAVAWAGHLLRHFGSLPELLGADLFELRRVAPEALALDVAVLHDLQRRTLEAPLRARPALSAWPPLAAYLRSVLATEGRAQFRVLFLDGRQRLIRDERLGVGSLDHAPAYPREVLRRALALDAAGVALVHNHPSGDLQPSAWERELLAQVTAAARTLRIVVHDQLLVAGGVVVSSRAQGRL